MARRKFKLILSAVMLALLSATTSVVIGTTTASAASCEYIVNAEIVGGGSAYITGAGPGNPVVLTHSGTCFSLPQTGVWNGYRWYEYQTPGGYCLQRNGSNVLQVATVACPRDTSHQSYQMFGVNNNGGWIWSNPLIFNNGGGSFWAPESCVVNSRVSGAVYSPCPRWYFP